MSILRITNLQGTSGSNNTITVPSGHNFQVNGTIDAKGEMYIPTWTNSTRPTANLEVGLVGYNTEEQITEVYTGDPTIGVNGWTIFGKTASKSLADSVGATPYLHYQAEDLDAFSNGTVLNSTNKWINQGSAGSSFDLINDSGTSTSVTIVTQNGIKAANFSGWSGLVFNTAAYQTFVQSSATQNWTAAYVYGGGDNGSTCSPSWSGNQFGGSGTNPPDRGGGGLFGWYTASSFGFSNWHDNDGWVPMTNNTSATSGQNNSTANQWIARVAGSQCSIWKGKSGSAFATGSLAGGSYGSASTYGSPIYLSGIGHVRNSSSTSYSVTGYLYDAVLFNTALSDTQIQALRDYYAAKYPVGNVAS